MPVIITLIGLMVTGHSIFDYRDTSSYLYFPIELFLFFGYVFGIKNKFSYFFVY
jgi:hypothetical protein